MVEDVFDTGVFFFTIKMAANRPSWISSRKKRTCLCKPSFLICVPCSNKIGKCMSDKQMRTCFTLGLFTTKMAASRPSWFWCRKKWRTYVYHHVLPLCQVQIKSVHRCLRYGCRHTHTDTDTKIETKSISPCFAQSPTWANNLTSGWKDDGEVWTITSELSSLDLHLGLAINYHPGVSQEGWDINVCAIPQMDVKLDVPSAGISW